MLFSGHYFKEKARSWGRLECRRGRWNFNNVKENKTQENNAKPLEVELKEHQEVDASEIKTVDATKQSGCT
jgi:hypothetical protein